MGSVDYRHTREMTTLDDDDDDEKKGRASRCFRAYQYESGNRN